jgi:hypothetical protein
MPDPSVRASDADRERIVEQLRRHTADGRLSIDEFEERMAAAYAARTYGELAQLTRDLPVDLAARAQSAGGGPSDAVPPWASAGRYPNPNTTGQANPGDIVGALVGAAMDWKLQKHELRHQLRARRHELRSARRGQAPAVAALAGWAGLSVLLTGIWFISGVTSSSGFSDFWPIWPIGILGVLTVSRFVKEVILRGGSRR